MIKNKTIQTDQLYLRLFQIKKIFNNKIIITLIKNKIYASVYFILLESFYIIKELIILVIIFWIKILIKKKMEKRIKKKLE
jgi:hypothetical protein